jgi:ADP-heptose:LPS heptosyltransferase
MIVTHDTGLMHIAAAFKKPVLAIWGNTIPELGMYAYFGKNPVSNFQAEVKGLNCRPCSKLGYKKCPEGHFNCMEQQDIAAMALFVKANLPLEFPKA